MHPAIRTQVDQKGDSYSAASALNFEGEPAITRQEFKDEADVNVLLSRYGVNVPLQVQPQYGETDWDLDLHSAYIAVERSQHAFRHLSPELREKYKSPAGMLDAMNSGELEKDLRAERDKVPVNPAVVSGSDSGPSEASVAPQAPE